MASLCQKCPLENGSGNIHSEDVMREIKRLDLRDSEVIRPKWSHTTICSSACGHQVVL